MSYPIYTPPERPVGILPGTNLATWDDVPTFIQQLGPQIQQLTNDFANLQAQNDDIAAGRWTPNNLVYQWGQLDTLGKLAVAAAGWFILRTVLKG